MAACLRSCHRRDQRKALLGTIQGVKVQKYECELVRYLAGAMIDSDGSDNRWSDPDWQADTSLHYKGEPIDAERVPYIVVPPAIIRGTKRIVLGCAAVVVNTKSGFSTDAVVADVGPARKIGEISVECAIRIGIPWNPVSGGATKLRPLQLPTG